ncbi:MAG: C26 family cysteine hydrolase domain-containing family, partial [Ruminococcaceae bacterium]|nr:C26 family cysteine hydrolase domain-containing family [Oscillospiraceae bacterium]
MEPTTNGGLIRCFFKTPNIQEYLLIQLQEKATDKAGQVINICLGMQIAVLEYARNVLGYADANSREFDEASKHLVIDYMPDQSDNTDKGGTMRLGSYPCELVTGTKLHSAYKSELIIERHRHRYEYNNEYEDELQRAGLSVAGSSPDKKIVEAVECKEHPFYVGCQFHPEFKSRPNRS